MTQRLFYEDPYVREFTARIVAHRESEGRPTVVLDRTAFYATSGGQPCDLGKLDGIDVIDVFEDGDEIVHVLAAPLAADTVKGTIDWGRRRDHMQQHHGQHILSEAFIRVAEAETTSFHLGKELCTIDLDKPKLSSQEILRAEDLANTVIFENRDVAIGFFGPEEARRQPLRKPPPDVPKIRLVHVRDFDCSPCSGTHPRRTGEVGGVLVTNVERGKENLQVSFVCGNRVLSMARRHREILRKVGSKMSVSLEETEAAVDRLRAETVRLRKALADADQVLAVFRARQLVAEAPSCGPCRVGVEIIPDKDIKYLQTLASAAIEEKNVVVLLGGQGATSSLVFARSPGVDLDLRPVHRDALALIQGKGGGAPHFVQGGGSGKEVAAALELARRNVAEALTRAS